MSLPTIPNRRAREAGPQHEADLDLARAAARGERHARRLLVDRLLDRVRAVTVYMARGDDDAQDHAQQAMIEILQSLHSFRGESSLETWSERIVVRSTMREVKRSRWRRRSLQTYVPEHDEPAPHVGEDELAHRRMKARLVEIFRELPLKQRLPVVLRLVFDHGIDDISTLTGARPNTVRDRLQSGRSRLRKLIRRDPVFQDWLEERDRANDR